MLKTRIIGIFRTLYILIAVFILSDAGNCFAQAVTLTRLSPNLNSDFGLSQDISADGNKVAFITYNGNYDGYTLYLLNRLTGNRQMIAQHLRSPYPDGPMPLKLAQNGQTLFYALQEHRNGNSWIDVVYKYDFNQMQQTEIGEGEFIDVSEDGNRILMYGSSYDLLLIDMHNSNPEIIAKNYGQLRGVPSISADGNCIGFASLTALEAEDTNSMFDIYMEDLRNNSIRRVSQSPSGEQSNGHSFGAKLGDNCDTLLFSTMATNLASEVPEGSFKLVKLNLSSNSYEVFGDATPFCGGPRCMPSYAMRGSNIIYHLSRSADNVSEDVFVKNLIRNSIVRLTAPPAGHSEYSLRGSQYPPSISADGRVGVFNINTLGDSYWYDSYMAVVSSRLPVNRAHAVILD